MTDLCKFLYQDVVIIDIDNKAWNGHAVLFDSADDNDNNEESIAIRIDKNKGDIIEFSQSEIKSIEIA